MYSQHIIFAKKVHWQKSIWNFHEAKKYDIAECTIWRICGNTVD